MTSGIAHTVGAVSPHTRTRLEKAAADNGFDQTLPASGVEQGWMAFASTKCSLWIWLAVDTSGHPLLALSQAKVAAALDGMTRRSSAPLPLGARALVSVPDIPLLHGALRRAFQLARTLPDAPLRRFEQETKLLPRTTEIERLVVQRVGQNIFRESLLDYWEGRCAITDLAVPELLRASHMKPWSQCETDAERLDVYNGVLLGAHLDAAFDCGLITFEDDGAVVIARTLVEPARQILGLNHRVTARGFAESHRPYLAWHRQHVFRGV